jgi:hypothetical protein
MRHIPAVLTVASLIVGSTLGEQSAAQYVQQGNKLVGSGSIGSYSQGTSVAIAADGSTAIIGGTGDNHYVGAAWIFTRSESGWIQQGEKLVGAGAVGMSLQGSAVALSADGNTAIVGGPQDNDNAGAAWIFVRSGGVWSQQGNKLVGTGTVGNHPFQGTSVALSADGNTAIVGGSGDSNDSGAVWVFTRSGGVWSQQGNKLVGAGRAAGVFLGCAVSLSADGNTAIAGAYNDSSQIGAAWVFTRSGSVWSQAGNKLVGSDTAGKAWQGTSVALSSDGTTALVGGHRDSGGVGAAWVFTKNGGVWTQQGKKLVGTGAVGAARQGASVSLSADGNTAVVGGNYDNNDSGAVWVFTRNGSTWSQQGSKLVGRGAVGKAVQGQSVSVSADGNTVVVGGPVDDNLIGAAWVFTRSGNVWSQHEEKLVGTGGQASAHQGYSVSLSGDGRTALMGGYGDRSNVGAAWIFTRNGEVWIQEGNKLVGDGVVGSSSYQGSSVALSGDGNTAVVGGPADNGLRGAMWAFTRSEGLWSQQGEKLVAGTGVYIAVGSSASISADGNTAIVGGHADNNSVGAAWVFTRSGGVWSPRNKLVGSGAVGSAHQGSAVSLSADGNTALVGGPGDNKEVGAVWVFTQNGGIWSQQGGKIVGTGAVGYWPRQGSSVALSADGSTAIVCGSGDQGGMGAAWVYTRSAGLWTQQGEKLVGTGVDGTALNQGTSVAVSADGNTAVIGRCGDNNGVGAVWVFTRSGGVWSQLGEKLVGTGGVGRSWQGSAVALSADASTIVVGGERDNNYTGAAWVFVRKPVDVETKTRGIPSSFELAQNYPNPFNPSTTIRYGLPHKSAVQLSVFNTLGQQVAQLVNGDMEAGYHEVQFDGRGLSSGVYVYRLQAGDFTQARRLLLLK